MLVSATEMINKAHEGHYAIAQFNINNMEWIKAILLGCEAKKSPVILGVSEGAAKYMCGYKNAVDMVKNIMEFYGITVPVAIHLDHGTYDGAKKAIEAGFTSVMFDGSHYPIEENIAKSKELIELAHSKGISIECEVGLNFDVLKEIQNQTNGKPLVLHGGSGIPQEMVKEAITMGVSKVNVNTECQIVFADATKKYIEDGGIDKPKGYDPRKLLKPGADAIQALVEDYVVNFFGSADKA